MTNKLPTDSSSNHVKKVYLVFKSHLDIGFTDYAANVVELYFEKYIPQAIKTAKEIRKIRENERFIWTTGSWLLNEYLEKANTRKRNELENAIGAGDIVWHALPFTTHSELMDASLFRFGLSLSKKLDRRFGKNTIAAKFTDVPGHTRAIVPLLAEAGVKFLHIGVNPASTSPDVPNLFVWKHYNDEIIVAYDKNNYGQTLVVPNFGSALSFLHKGDNTAPPCIEEIVTAYEQNRQLFPFASVNGASMDDYAKTVLTLRAKLPIINSEIGDTWIHGIGSDPEKIAQFRQLCRLRNEWLKKELIANQSKRLEDFSKNLLLIAEHTWGLDQKTHLPDFQNYEKETFRLLRKTAKYRYFEESWHEQRLYIQKSLDTLGKGQLSNDAYRCLENIIPAKPNKNGFKRVDDLSQIHRCDHFDIRFNSNSGAIDFLKHRETNQIWASQKNMLAYFSYMSFSQTDYDRFWKQYIVNKREVKPWALLDFTKPGIDGIAKSCSWEPTLLKMYTKHDDEGSHFILEMTMSPESTQVYGAPVSIILEIDLPKEESYLACKLQWFKKAASRLPEAIWFSFCPKISDGYGWKINKMDTMISPYDVVSGGNQSLHAVGRGVTYHDMVSTLQIESLDAALVALGQPALLNFSSNPLKLTKGMHFNLYNNVWGTNFPMWYEKDAIFRFNLIFESDKRH